MSFRKRFAQEPNAGERRDAAFFKQVDVCDDENAFKQRRRRVGLRIVLIGGGAFGRPGAQRLKSADRKGEGRKAKAASPGHCAASQVEARERGADAVNTPQSSLYCL